MKKNVLYIFQPNIIHIFKNVDDFKPTETGATFTYTKTTTFQSESASKGSVSTPAPNSKVTIFSGGMFVEWESSSSN